MRYFPYAGIGSRETPEDILILMGQISAYLEREGYTLRSGGCTGPDQAFQDACKTQELYVPWDGYNGYNGHIPTPAGYQLAAQHHPAWDSCSRGAQAMHARNGHIILGPNLDSPVKFVVCWTKNGKASGGTGQGIRIAEAHNITVLNLKNQHVVDYWQSLVYT